MVNSKYELLDSEGSDSMKSIEDYMEFSIKNKNAKKNGNVWTNYSVDRWLKNYIKTEGGSIAGGDSNYFIKLIKIFLFNLISDTIIRI